MNLIRFFKRSDRCPTQSTTPSAIVLLTVIALSTLSGCHDLYERLGESKRIPYPLADELPFEVEGSFHEIWTGNQLQINRDTDTTYLTLQGVGDLELGDEVEGQAIKFMRTLFSSENLSAVIHRYDEMKRPIAQVYCGDTHFNLEMIKNGWGRFNGTTFAESEEFAAAEQQARRQKLGIWGLEDP